MARSKVLPPRRPRDEESLLLRSAESLGRIIGSLQRQLDGVATRLPDLSQYAPDPLAENDGAAGATSTVKRAAARRPSRSGKRTAAGRRPPAASKVLPATDRKSRRAAKSASVKKAAGRQSGARKTARKSTRGG